LLVADGALFLLGLAVARPLWPAITQSARALLAGRRKHWGWPGTITAGLFTGFLTFLALVSCASPMTDYDSLASYLPVMTAWLQTERFAAPDPAALLDFYPFNWHALAFPLLLPLGDDMLLALANALALLLLFASVYVVAGLTGARPSHALAAACIATSLPLMAINFNGMRVDLPFAAFVIAALALCGTYLKRFEAIDFALSLSALGMLAGIKTPGLIFAAILLVLFCLLAAVAWRHGLLPIMPAQKPRLLSIALAAAAAMTGSFWYVKNLIEYHNPLGLVKITLAGRTIFPGNDLAAKLRETTLLAKFAEAGPGRLEIVAAGFIAQWQIPFIIFSSFSLLAIVPRIRRKLTREFAAVAGLLILFSYSYAAMPFTGAAGIADPFTPWFAQAIRYGYQAWALAPVLGAAALSAAGLPAGVAAVLSLTSIIVSLNVFLMHNGDVQLRWPALIALAAACFITVCLQRTGAELPIIRRLTGWRKAVASAILLLALTIGSAWAVTGFREQRMRLRLSHYGPADRIIAALLPPDAPIGYTLCHRSYVLYGQSLQRRVISLPWTPRDPHGWLTRVREAGVAMVAAGPFDNPDKLAAFTEWMAKENSQFVLAHEPRVHRRSNESYLYVIAVEKNPAHTSSP